MVPSLDGATMDVVDPATGSVVAGGRRLGGRCRAAPSGRPGPRSTTAAGGRAPLEKERRLRRLSALVAEHGDMFAEIDVIDAGLLRMYTGFIVQFAVDGIDYYSGSRRRSPGRSPRPDRVRRLSGARAHRRDRADHAVERPDAVLAFVAAALAGGNSVVLKPAEQTPMAAVMMAELAWRPGSRRAWSTSCRGGVSGRRRPRRASRRRRDVVHRLGGHRAGASRRPRHSGSSA